jgi:hypothetical protein
VDVARAIAERLTDVRWLGGVSGAGKSTIARLLADRHGLRVYSTDEAIQPHMARSTASTHPLMHAFREMSMDERWVDRSPEVMLDTFHGFQGEGFELIVEDLLADDCGEPLLVEGFRLLPRLVAPLLTRRDRAVWLLPTPAFRASANEARGSTWTIAGRTSDPARALANLGRRDAMFTELVAREASALGLTTIDVDVGQDLGSLVVRVASALGLPGSRREV